jgi:hypothetical protein
MNDFSELEVELKALRPAPVSPSCGGESSAGLPAGCNTGGRGVATQIEKRDRLVDTRSQPRGRLRRDSGWARLFAEPPASQPTLARTSPRVAEPPNGGLQPSALTRVVYRKHDDGLVFLA